MGKRQEFEARVTNVTDPDGLFRVQVMIDGLFDGVPESDLPWATIKFPIGSRPNAGDYSPCQIGDWVWVDFPYLAQGEPDTRRPRITGSVHFAPQGTLNAPHEAISGNESIELNSDGFTRQRPDGSRIYTIGGLTVEYLSNNTYRVIHRESKTHLEITENILLRSENGVVLHAETDTNINVGAALTISVTGAANIIADSVSVTATNAATVSGKDVTVNASASATVEAKGTAIIKAPNVTIGAGGGAGVITGAAICPFTKSPHPGASATVLASP